MNDEDHESLIVELQHSTPHIGESLVIGRLRALRNSNPLNRALKWPGVITIRRPYSVNGPNSLWHIHTQEFEPDTVLIQSCVTNDHAVTSQSFWAAELIDNDVTS